MNIDTAEVQLQEEQVEFSNNETLKNSFQNGDRVTEFWLQSKINNLSSGLWTIVKFLVAFPFSYLVERRIGAVADLIIIKRSRLQIMERGNLRLHLSKSIEPSGSETGSDALSTDFPLIILDCFIDITLLVYFLL
ncbi:uncharacterized protein LOC118184688, partial [Stegodyphus dumicola]|uniref:uncharacterized protein LOC118184688 n=1 Tax=Stegodyphus dumicola TaxID=202533 RepID=UPI0015B008BA